MQNVIINHLLDGSKAVITHWDHFHVNRATGSTINRAFTIKYLTGDKAETAMSGQSVPYMVTSKSLGKMRLAMPKLPKCAYVKGDLVSQGGQMGIVTRFGWRLLYLPVVRWTALDPYHNAGEH